MGFQWTIIAIVLYSEIAVTILFLLPIVSAKRWRALFRSRLGQCIGTYANYYLSIFVLVLSLCLFDAVKEMRKLTNMEKPKPSHAAAIEHINVRLFRAQRNFYIAGFSLFMFFVLRRLITLLIQGADLVDKVEVSDELQSAHNKERTDLQASVADLQQKLDLYNEAKIKSLAEWAPAVKEDEFRVGSSDGEKALVSELADARDVVSKTQAELADMKERVVNANLEFDRLNTDNQNLQTKYNSLLEAGAGGDTKASQSPLDGAEAADASV